MKIAINNLDNLNKLKGNEIIYIFDKEPLEELIKTGLHCIRKDYIENVDINLTDFFIQGIS